MLPFLVFKNEINYGMLNMKKDGGSFMKKKHLLLLINSFIMMFPAFVLGKPQLIDTEFYYIDRFRETWYPRVKIISGVILIIYTLVSCIYFNLSKEIKDKKKKKLLYWFFNVLVIILILYLSVEHYVQFELR
jgi:hypothetical protein